KTADKYFGSENPVGKMVRVENREDYSVAGVYEDMPSNSHFHFDLLLSLSTLNESRSSSRVTLNFPTYLLVREGVDILALEKKFEPLVFKHVGEQQYHIHLEFQSISMFTVSSTLSGEPE
ncbi:MAG: ABC transporter permease, partial [Acidobacteriota bacterium]